MIQLRVQCVHKRVSLMLNVVAHGCIRVTTDLMGKININKSNTLSPLQFSLTSSIDLSS
jgi:hypothetical protein